MLPLHQVHAAPQERGGLRVAQLLEIDPPDQLPRRGRHDREDLGHDPLALADVHPPVAVGPAPRHVVQLGLVVHGRAAPSPAPVVADGEPRDGDEHRLRVRGDLVIPGALAGGQEDVVEHLPRRLGPDVAALQHAGDEVAVLVVGLAEPGSRGVRERGCGLGWGTERALAGRARLLILIGNESVGLHMARSPLPRRWGEPLGPDRPPPRGSVRRGVSRGENRELSSESRISTPRRLDDEATRPTHGEARGHAEGGDGNAEEGAPHAEGGAGTHREMRLTQRKARLTHREAMRTQRKVRLTHREAMGTHREMRLTQRKARLTHREAMGTHRDTRLTQRKARLTHREARMGTQQGDAPHAEGGAGYAQGHAPHAQDARLTQREARGTQRETHLRDGSARSRHQAPRRRRQK